MAEDWTPTEALVEDVAVTLLRHWNVPEDDEQAYDTARRDAEAVLGAPMVRAAFSALVDLTIDATVRATMQAEGPSRGGTT